MDRWGRKLEFGAARPGIPARAAEFSWNAPEEVRRQTGKAGDFSIRLVLRLGIGGKTLKGTETDKDVRRRNQWLFRSRSGMRSGASVRIEHRQGIPAFLRHVVPIHHGCLATFGQPAHQASPARGSSSGGGRGQGRGIVQIVPPRTAQIRHRQSQAALGIDLMILEILRLQPGIAPGQVLALPPNPEAQSASSSFRKAPARPPPKAPIPRRSPHRVRRSAPTPGRGIVPKVQRHPLPFHRSAPGARGRSGDGRSPAKPGQRRAARPAEGHPPRTSRAQGGWRRASGIAPQAGRWCPHAADAAAGISADRPEVRPGC